jgi:hypothetical protein
MGHYSTRLSLLDSAGAMANFIVNVNDRIQNNRLQTSPFARIDHGIAVMEIPLESTQFSEGFP